MRKDQKQDLDIIRSLQELAEVTGIPMVVSKAPLGSEDRQRWVSQMIRITITGYIHGGAKCQICGHQYESVDDFIARDPVHGGPKIYIDRACWEARPNHQDGPQ